MGLECRGESLDHRHHRPLGILIHRACDRGGQRGGDGVHRRHPQLVDDRLDMGKIPVDRADAHVRVGREFGGAGQRTAATPQQIHRRSEKVSSSITATFLLRSLPSGFTSEFSSSITAHKK